MVGGRGTHSLPTLAAELPLLDEFGASRKYFTSLLSRSGTPHVRLCVALAAARKAFPKEPMPSLTWPSALACSPIVCRVLSLWIATSSWSSVALRFTSSVLLQRLLRGHTEFTMDCSAIANFPEGVAKFDACGFMCSPAISKILGCCGEHVTRAVQVILQTTLFFQGTLEFFGHLQGRNMQCVAGLLFMCDIGHGDLKVHILFRQGVQC